MGKVLDITEKLKFEENPALIISGKKYEVNADANTMIEVMAEIDSGDGMNPASISKLCKMIFTNKAQKDLEKLHLKLGDYTTVVSEAINLISDSGEDEEGE